MIFAAKASEAAKVLEVELNGLTSDTVRKAYRNKVKECHPDHHGNAKLQMWSQVSWAKEVLDRWLVQNPEPSPSTEIAGTGNCRACEGTGRVRLSTGSFGKPLTMMCVLCNGSGSLEPKEDDSD